MIMIIGCSDFSEWFLSTTLPCQSNWPNVACPRPNLPFRTPWNPRWPENSLSSYYLLCRGLQNSMTSPNGCEDFEKILDLKGNGFLKKRSSECIFGVVQLTLPIPATRRPNIQSVLQMSNMCYDGYLVGKMFKTYIWDERGESGLTIALTMISPCSWNVKKSR